MSEKGRPIIETAELGYNFTPVELLHCKAIYGAVAWPGKRPGFAVVIGMTPNNEMYLLDEYESGDIGELVKRCGTLNFEFYFNSNSKTRRWFGDYEHAAARKFIQEMNRKTENRDPFSLYGLSILNMKENGLYEYILPKLKGEFLKADKKRLFLKNSKVRDYLSSIGDPQESTMKLGEYPAIEAVAIAAIELQREAERILNRVSNSQHKSSYDNNILTRGLRKPKISPHPIQSTF